MDNQKWFYLGLWFIALLIRLLVDIDAAIFMVTSLIYFYLVFEVNYVRLVLPPDTRSVDINAHPKDETNEGDSTSNTNH